MIPFYENQTLHEQMIQKGYRFHRGERYQHYVDQAGNFVEYPVGYVTTQLDRLMNRLQFYFSVKGPDGWHQRYFYRKSEGEAWAREKQKEFLSKVSFS